MDVQNATPRENNEETPSDGLQKSWEAAFRAWRIQRGKVKRISFIFPVVGIIVGYGLVFLVLQYVREGVTVWGIFGIVMLVFIYFLYVVLWPISQWISLRRHTPAACIHAARIGAQELQNGNSVKASWYIENLLYSLTDYLRYKSVTVGGEKISPRKIIVLTPDSIPRKAVLRAVQEEDNTRKLQHMLGDFEQGLQRTYARTYARFFVEDTGYVTVSVFLTRLRRMTEPYHQEVQTLFDRHPTLIAVMRVVGPLVLSSLVAWLVEA